MLFANYTVNQYHVNYKSNHSENMNSSYINLNGGINFGLWSYRQQSSFTKQNNDNGHFQTTNRNIQRTIVPIKGELTAGGTYTSGSYFSGFGFRGVTLQSDTRMLPESQQGYAPVINGIARTNAKVTAKQDGSIIYQTTVPSGPFTIDDLYSTNYAGDIEVNVQEPDGSIQSFIVPYSSVPGALRAGASRYSISLGKSRYVRDNDLFVELIYRRGLNNRITLNSGYRVAKNYHFFVLGSAYSSKFGAIGLDVTVSNAELPSGTETGWKSQLSYS